jgi:nucleoid-associated protein YgaU
MVVLTLLLLLAAGAGLLAASAGDAASPPGAAPRVVVRAGDTLWSLAARYEPDQSPYGAIEEIRRLNGLDGYTIRVGQTLILPAHR